MDAIGEAAERAPGRLAVNPRGTVGLDHELGQRELTVYAIEQHALVDFTGPQPVEAVDVVLRHHLVLLRGEGERLRRE